MKTMLIITLLLAGCAATVVKYDWCFGLCGSVTVDKDATPTHVSESVKETVKTVTETRND